MRFIGGASKQGRAGNIQGLWYPDRSIVVITSVGVLVEESLSKIVINYRRAVIRLEFVGEGEWINSLEEG